MELSDRKKKILQLVVDDYIETAAPVSSKSITEKYLTSISSATVRSELSTLEELGYLSQPHTSAGRVPSKEAYRLYVNELMVKEKLSPKELDYIERIFTEKVNGMDDVIKTTAKVISELTQYTSLALTARDANETIKNIRLFRFKPDGALLVIVTDTKLLKDTVIDVPAEMSDETVAEANEFLSNVFTGKTLREVCLTDADALQAEFDVYKTLFAEVIDALKAYVTESDEVILEGEDKIFAHPEYADVDKLKNFMSVVTSKDKLLTLLSDDGKEVKINVKIGTDGYDEIPEDCSLISATYSANGVKIGTYGVIGPIRMDYKKVVAVLENVGRILESIISKR